MRRPIANNFSVKSGVCHKCSKWFTFVTHVAKYCDDCREVLRLERKRASEKNRKRVRVQYPRYKRKLIPYAGYDGGRHG